MKLVSDIVLKNAKFPVSIDALFVDFKSYTYNVYDTDIGRYRYALKYREIKDAVGVVTGRKKAVFTSLDVDFELWSRIKKVKVLKSTKGVEVYGDKGYWIVDNIDDIVWRVHDFLKDITIGDGFFLVNLYDMVIRYDVTDDFKRWYIKGRLNEVCK